MGLRPASPRPRGRGGRRSDLGRRLAALVTALLTALSLAVPGALAAPAPPDDDPREHFIVPPGTESGSFDQLGAWEEALREDPFGWELVALRNTFERKWPKNKDGSPHWGKNVAGAWYDLGWAKNASGLPPWFRPDEFSEKMLAELQRPSKPFDIRGDYESIVTPVERSGNEPLYKGAGGSRLIQIGTSNVAWEAEKKGTDRAHSEEVAIAMFKQAAARVFREMSMTSADGRQARAITQGAAQQMAEWAHRNSARVLGTEKGTCYDKCRAAAKDFRKVTAVARYGLKKSVDAERARHLVPLVIGRAMPKVAKQQEARKKQRQAEQEQKRKKMLSLDPGKSCDMGGAAGRPASYGRGRLRAMSIGGLPLAAAPCSPGKESSGLGRALGTTDYGGVDFSSLEMRFLSDDPGSGGVQYSFSGRPASPGLQQGAESGNEAVMNSAADLRTWLVLDSTKFWVNLNPSEPNRIIDPGLGQTNAGRALLEADLEMKRTGGRLLDPDTELGARYWKAMMGSDRKSCYSSRMWIIPGDVQVREDGGSLYILKASLDVKAKAERIAGTSMDCVPDPAANARNERLEQEILVPKVVKAVNEAPEYAPIRRAFLARVVAQWIRKRHQEGHPTSFDKLIDSGDIGPAKLQGGWRPKQVFDRYVRSIENKEFTYKQTTREGGTTVIRTMVYGGVDFSQINPTAVSAAQMDRQNPRLPQTVKSSRNRPAAAPDGSIWLGETAGSPDSGLLSRSTASLRSLASGRTGLVALLVVALLVVTFGIRGGTGRKRKAT